MVGHYSREGCILLLWVAASALDSGMGLWYLITMSTHLSNRYLTSLISRWMFHFICQGNQILNSRAADIMIHKLRPLDESAMCRARRASNVV